MAALLLLPVEVSDGSWLQEIFKGSLKEGKSPKHITSQKHVTAPKRVTSAKPAASPKPHTVKLAALGPVAFPASKPVVTMCDPSKFRIVLDVGHTAESDGATSARNVAAFVSTRRLAQRI